MDIKIQQGEGNSQAILRQLQSRDDIADDAVLNKEAWNSIFSEFQTDENSTHKENKIKDEWTELNMNVHTEIDDDIKIDDSIWAKIVDIAKKALEEKPTEAADEAAEDGDKKTSEEGAAITKDDCRTTNCEGVYYHEETKTHYVEKDGKLEPMESKYQGSTIIEVMADGSWRERQDNDEAGYRIYHISKDNVQLSGTDFNDAGTKIRDWVNDENGDLKECKIGDETKKYENGILFTDKKNGQYGVFKELGGGKYILKICGTAEGEDQFVLYEKNSFTYEYFCDRDGNKIES